MTTAIIAAVLVGWAVSYAVRQRAYERRVNQAVLVAYNASVPVEEVLDQTERSTGWSEEEARLVGESVLLAILFGVALVLVMAS